MPPPDYSPVHSPAPSLSVSSDTPHTNLPSIHSELETEPTQTHTERTEVITHEIDRLLDHIHELDHLRSQDSHEISENVRIIRDELYDLSEYVRTHLVEAEGVIVTERPEPPAVARRDQAVGAISVISDRRDQAVGAMSVISEPRVAPAGPRSHQFLRPIVALSPPPVRSPSIISTNSSMSFLSSHHSDDFSLLGSDEVEIPPPSPVWASEPSSPSSDPTLSIISSSELSPGPTLSLTSSSASLTPTPPPSSPTPSTESTGSSTTARQVPGITMTAIRDMLAQVREQTTALWEGQTSTNDMLDELRQSRLAPQDNTEIFDRLHHIETLIETLINTRQDTTQRDERDERDHQEVEETETVRVIDTTQRLTRHRVEGSVTESEDSQADAESLLSRWRDMVRGRDRAHFPLAMPVPHRPGPSLDEQLMELLNVPPASVPSNIQAPPQLIPFVYQPAPRPSRSRSTTPVLRRDSAPPFQEPIWSPERMHSPRQPRPRPRHPLIRPPRTGQPATHETPSVIPGSIPDRTPRPEHVTHDLPPPQRERSPERRPSVRPPGPFLVCFPDRLLQRDLTPILARFFV